MSPLHMTYEARSGEAGLLTKGERACVRACVRECVCVYVFVCPRSYLGKYTSDLHHFFVYVVYGRGSVLLWLRSDTLYFRFHG